MINQQIIKALGYLYRIVEAGERGYAVSAANVNNRGLKILFKSYAQQRAKFKDEILSEIRGLAGTAKPGSSLRGMIHRGRINIFAAMTIGSEDREKVILKEVRLGEKIAIQAYQKTLKKELPVNIREIVARQYAEVSKVVERVHRMLGKDGKRMIVQLFDSENKADAAIASLNKDGFHTGTNERIILGEATELYEGKGTSVFETFLSGAVGGGLWGNLIGAFAGIGAEETANLVINGVAPAQNVWLIFALLGILGGAFIGGALGFVIGIGISGEDSYLYTESKEPGHVLLLAMIDFSRATEVSRFMEQFNHAANASAKDVQRPNALETSN